MCFRVSCPLPWLFGFADRVYLPHLIVGFLEISTVAPCQIDVITGWLARPPSPRHSDETNGGGRSWPKRLPQILGSRYRYASTHTLSMRSPRHSAIERLRVIIQHLWIDLTRRAKLGLLRIFRPWEARGHFIADD